MPQELLTVKGAGTLMFRHGIKVPITEMEKLSSG
jgi:hypothetical protein